METIPKERIPPLDIESNQPIIRTDRRGHDRITSHNPLIIAPFGRRLYHEYHSMTFNHSKNGMCLETAEPFNPGRVLCIRLRNSVDDRVYHDGNGKYLRTFTLAEVKWCHECRDDFSTYYRIGVRYY